uniref:Uncharacterized protein n=1 Tax=Anguilla anguilla TaxID=7936 RepID=A0A0E9XCF7_ANGAN
MCYSSLEEPLRPGTFLFVFFTPFHTDMENRIKHALLKKHVNVAA